MRKRDLAAAVKAAGGTKQLAILLSTTQRTIQRWVKDGAPTKGATLKRFGEYQQEIKAAARLAREERNIFDMLFKEAGELGRLPTAKSGTKRRDGPRTFGFGYTKAINRMSSPAIVPRVQAWATGLPRQNLLNVWQGQVLSTQYALPGAHGETVSFLGYQTVRTVEQMSTLQSGDFGVGLLMATPRSATKVQALKLIASNLQELHSSHSLLVFIHSVTLLNYRFRTESERKVWETQERKLRTTQKEARDRKTSSKKRSKRLSKLSTVKKKVSRQKKR